MSESNDSPAGLPRKTWAPPPKEQCPHCGGSARRIACKKCMRDMCDDCISVGNLGPTCGLCADREDGRRRYDALKAAGRTVLDFDQWYDQHG